MTNHLRLRNQERFHFSIRDFTQQDLYSRLCAEACILSLYLTWAKYSHGVVMMKVLWEERVQRILHFL
jgi:hypothetical protein